MQLNVWGSLLLASRHRLNGHPIWEKGCVMVIADPLDLGNLFVYQAGESSLVPAVFLTVQFLQKLYIYEAFVVMKEPLQCKTYQHPHLNSAIAGPTSAATNL